MKHVPIRVFLVLLFSFAAAHNASAAAVYTVGGSSIGGTLIDLSSAGTVDFPATTQTVVLPTATLAFTNAGIVTGSDMHGAPPKYEMPTGLSDTDSYIALEKLKGNDGSVVLSAMPLSVTQVGFLWGSIGEHDTLVVTNRLGGTAAISGWDILHLAGSGLQNGDTTYFSVKDLAGIKSIAFLSDTSGATTFEVANLSYVPLPAALPLFGASLIGLAALRRRRSI